MEIASDQISLSDSAGGHEKGRRHQEPPRLPLLLSVTQSRRPGLNKCRPRRCAKVCAMCICNTLQFSCVSLSEHKSNIDITTSV